MDAPDFTDRYNTALPPDREAAFQQWVSAANKQGDLRDYDLRGAFASDAKKATNGHLPDTWKKPNHPTFSRESMYSGVDGDAGGEWRDAGNGKWVYYASPGNVANMGADGLQSYFNRVEPDSSLVLDVPQSDMTALDRIFRR